MLVVSALYVARQVHYSRVAQHTTVELEKRRRSLELIERFNGKDIVELRGTAVHAMNYWKDGQTPGSHDVLVYLNFF